MTNAKRYYRPELDALRFCAFLGVFFFHGLLYFSPGAYRHLETYHLGWAGQWGVPLFFFLSSFLIVELLLREKDATGTIELRKFYIRRMLRIWPLYFFAFTAFAVLNLWIPGVNPGFSHTWPYFLFFVGNWYVGHHGFFGRAVDPLWSISVEEQFYLLIPAIAAFGGRKALRIAALAAVVGAYVTIYQFARLPRPDETGEWVNSFVQFQFFAGGALLAIYLNDRVPQWSWPVRALGFASGLACWIVAQTAFGVRGWKPSATVAQAFAGWPLILAGCAFFLLAFLGLPGERIPRWIVYMGRISFGLYVYHALVYDLVFEIPGRWLLRPKLLHVWWRLWAVWGCVAVVFAVTTLLAHLSYRYYERPFLKLKERFAVVPSRPE